LHRKNRADWCKNSRKSAMCSSKRNRPLQRRPFRSKATYSLLPSCLAARNLLCKWSIDI
jgi:hypothetical protein